jgi:hypothetical protein
MNGDLENSWAGNIFLISLSLFIILYSEVQLQNTALISFMRTLLLLLLLFVAHGCSKKNDETRVLTIKTPNGRVTAKEEVTAPEPQEVVVVEAESLQLLQSLMLEGPRFVSHFLPDVTEPGLEEYDLAFRAWQDSESTDFSNEDVIRIVGGYLGNRFVTDFDMEWVTVTDQYGTDYATRSKTVEAMAFPFSMVMKRVESNKDNFIFAVYYTVKDTIDTADIRARDARSEE